MHLDNGTAYPAAFTGAQDSTGRDYVVVVVKGTFTLPDGQDAACRPAAGQAPLVMADEFWGEPGHSAPRVEMDFAHVKMRCDILLDGAVHAPGGRPAERVRAGIRVGGWSKILEAVGNRVWLVGLSGAHASDIRPFVTMPISYDLAFGGIDDSHPQVKAPYSHPKNPVGRGWHQIANLAHLNGRPMPNIEMADHPVRQPWDDALPVGLGPIGRGWADRLKYAGTYDQHWLDKTFPFLPKDFDPRYYQAAPEDQQIAHPAGGELITLVNLSDRGRESFRLPDARMPMLFSRRRAEDVSVNAPLDTIMIRPDAREVHLTWRASLPLSRDIFEVTECIIGRRSGAFWRARKMGKTYYPSLKSLLGREHAT